MRRVQSFFYGVAASAADAYPVHEASDEVGDRDADGREIQFFEVGGFLLHRLAIGVFARELIPAKAARCARTRGVEVVDEYPAVDAPPGKNGGVERSMNRSFELFV